MIAGMSARPRRTAATATTIFLGAGLAIGSLVYPTIAPNPTGVDASSGPWTITITDDAAGITEQQHVEFPGPNGDFGPQGQQVLTARLGITTIAAPNAGSAGSADSEGSAGNAGSAGSGGSAGGDDGFEGLIDATVMAAEFTPATGELTSPVTVSRTLGMPTQQITPPQGAVWLTFPERAQADSYTVFDPISMKTSEATRLEPSPNNGTTDNDAAGLEARAGSYGRDVITYRQNLGKDANGLGFYVDYVVDEASGVVLDRFERRPMSDGRDGVFQGQATQESVDAMIAYVDALPNPAVRTWAVRVAGVVGGLLLLVGVGLALTQTRRGRTARTTPKK